MIILFSDFGLEGPYVGQMKSVLASCEPGMPVIDLMHDVPPFDAKGAAYLLASLVGEMPRGAVVVAVVDPGVGSARRALAVKADGRWFLGPDNGLFELVVRRAASVEAFEITWCPARLSSTFHGRDLFAPVAAQLSRGDTPDFLPLAISDIARPEWPNDLPAVIYCDRFGNLVTGLRAATLPEGTDFDVNGWRLTKLRTFSDARPGEAFWYENANGLAEIAVNQGNAAQLLAVGLRGEISVIRSPVP